MGNSQWADNTKAVILPIKTTASNEAEHSIARQSIEELLELQSAEIEKTYLTTSRNKLKSSKMKS